MADFGLHTASVASASPVRTEVGQSQGFTLVEFFAGGGLARLGFGPGWDVVLANDFSTKKAETYRRNFGDAELVVGDIAKIRARDIPQANCWWASFPCTDHSTAGLMNGFKGVRGSSVFALVKRLQAAKRIGLAPDVVVFENVLGFLSYDKGGDFCLLVHHMGLCGYNMGAVVMDAEDWLPQGRRRVFLVAVRNNVPLPSGCHSHKRDPRWHPKVLTDAVKRLSRKQSAGWFWWTLPKPEAHSLTLADIVEMVGPDAWFGQDAIDRFLELLDVPGRVILAAMRERGAPTLGTMVERTHAKLGFRIAAIRELKAFTLMASATGTSRQRLIEVNGEDIRIREYTTRELGRLMGVPETYSPPDKLCPAMWVMGDAVAVPVVHHLVKHLVEPLVLAAREAGSKPEHIPQDGRRPLKERTIGTIAYMLPDDNERVRRFAVDEGLPLYQLLVLGANALMVAKGEKPLRTCARWLPPQPEAPIDAPPPADTPCPVDAPLDDDDS